MIDYWKDYDDIAQDLEAVRTVMTETLRSRVSELDEALSDLARNPGKMLRPAFLLISGRFGTPDDQKLHRMAAAVEILHMATLVHDDVLDDADTRRGRPSVHSRFGKKRAILIGDFLLARSFNLIAEYAGPANSKRLSQAAMEILSGEISQSSGLFTMKKSVREYLQRIAGKTAVLFAVSCYTGATESGVDEKTSSVLRRIGYDIGMGFQIMDDILDFESSKTVMGKPVGNDIRQGVFTLPLILSFETNGRAASDELSGLLASPPYADDVIDSVIGLVKRRGGTEKAREFASRYTDRAYREISRLPDGRPRDLLSVLAGKLLERKY